MSRPGFPPSRVTAQSVTQTHEQGEHLQPTQGVHSGAQPLAGEVQQGRWARSGPEVWTDQTRDVLAAEFTTTLQRGVHGLCFSPYLEGQQPGDQIGEAPIRERLQIIRPHTGWVRSFSCTDGHEQTPRIAHELGFKTLVGAWLGTDAKINEAELQAEKIVADANRKLVQIVDDINELKRQRVQFEAQVKGVIEAHLKLLETFRTATYSAKIQENVSFLAAKKSAE